MSEPSNVKPARTGWYTFARVVFNIVFFFCPLKFHEKQRLDRAAPFIVIANHQSWLDPMAIAVACPHEISFMGKKELAASKLAAYLVRKLHMISVDRHASDIQAMRKCSQVLKSGGVLGMFPEGTRHQSEMMGEVENGVALLALRSRAPIVPVYIDRKIGLFRRVRVYVGEDIRYQDLIERGSDMETVTALSERIRSIFYQMRETAR